MKHERIMETVEMLAITTSVATYAQTILSLLLPHALWLESLFAVLYILAGIGAIVLTQPKKDVNIFDLSNTPFNA